MCLFSPLKMEVMPFGYLATLLEFLIIQGLESFEL